MQDFTIKLTPQELQVVVDGLGELPLKQALAVHSSISRQYQEQVRHNESKGKDDVPDK